MLADQIQQLYDAWRNQQGIDLELSSALAPKALVAADISRTAVEKGQQIAKELGIRNTCREQADIQALPFASDQFDTVISCETIEHVPNPRLQLVS
jgi:2-polyprenyl-3-methyl-5-hydroxy-6-metoxy-1,4-benzoquinol methylase